MQASVDDSRVTVDRMKGCVQNGPFGRREFREHLRRCSVCRLTQYSGLRPTQSAEYAEDTDCGSLCETGFDLFVAPDLMRASADPRAKRVSTEGVMRAMGFLPDWSDL